MKKKNGFSLIELLTVIIILGLIVVIVLPVYDNVKEKTNRDAMAAQEDLVELAGIDYFLSNRNQYPFVYGNNSKVYLSTLVTDGYIDEIYDVDGALCDLDTSFVSATNAGPGRYLYHTYINCTGSADDITIPIITLSGANPQIVSGGSSYSELGATALDDRDGNITSSLVIDSSLVNTSILGDYIVTYNVQDSSSNPADQVTRTVSVVDGEAPIIALIGNSTESMIQGADYEELWATATDNRNTGPWLLANMVIDSSDIDNNTIGSYSVTYNVTDNAGNPATEVIRTINVVSGTFNFAYTGDYQAFTAFSSGKYKVELWGAEGGRGIQTAVTAGTPGKGAYTTGVIELNAGDVFYVYVGEKGPNAVEDVTVSGGYNGGGQGDHDHNDDEAGGGGGGATDIRLVSGNWNDVTGLNSRIMVSGGGGGTVGTTATSNSGGGNISSGNHYYYALAYTYGANQIDGYQFGVGQPGIWSSSNKEVAGGGGGYYGGLADSAAPSTITRMGTGGSSFASGYPGCNAITSSSDRTPSNQSVHYSGMEFADVAMTSNLRSGDGAATITYVTTSTTDFGTITYALTDSYHIFSAPKTGIYKIELWGAEAGRGLSTGVLNKYGGKGGYSKGEISLTAGETLYIHVGGGGSDAIEATIVSGGYNGGGQGDWDHADDEAGGGGGGATDVRVSYGDWDHATSLNSRIMVSGGGGGAVGGGAMGTGGTVSGANSVASSTQVVSYGGNQTTGYDFGIGQPGVFSNANWEVGGGGGGYYGGRTSATSSLSRMGAGGSSFISGYSMCNAITSSSDRTPSNQPDHYSGKTFINGEMTSGVRTGDGVATITYLASSTETFADVLEFDITDSYNIYEVPRTGNYKIELWGAQGGQRIGTGVLTGTLGYGAYTKGELSLTAGEVIYIYVGGRGSDGKVSTIVPGGYNGGGQGDWDHNDDEAGSAGGGATDIRLVGGVWNNSTSLNSRIMVSGGGGGGTIDGSSGGLTAYIPFTGSAASQTAGYQFGVGAPGVNFSSNRIAGGSGSGYYGGVVNSTVDGSASGAGGSSYISGHTGAVAITSSSDTTPKSGCTEGTTDNSCSVHYSTEVFTNTTMIDGQSYSWTNVIGSQIAMPNPSGGTYSLGTGNINHGYAIITFLN